MTDASPHTTDRPFRLRLTTSPLRDIVRFRATGRLELKIYPERAALPTALADLVVRLAKKTHLRALEKADVARELSAHFAEGVAAGKTTDELIDSFGDIDKAVKLIRRAKKRNRSRVLRAAQRALVGSFATLAILYAGVLIWYMFGIGKVNPTHDYLADFNAVAAAVPKEDRAWPVYREVFLQMGVLPKEVYRCKGPADYRWPQTVSYLEAHQPELEQIRRAANMPGLGFVVGTRFSKIDSPLFDPDGSETDKMQEQGSSDMIPMIEYLLPHLRYLRWSASMLHLDALHQIESGSTAGVIPDIKAMVGIARHASEQDTLISQLVRISIHAAAVETAAQLLSHSGKSLTDKDLTTLDNLFNPLIVGDLCAVNMTGERYMLEDFEQHVYTDNGRGNGRLQSDMMLIDIDDPTKLDSMSFLLAAPVSALMPDRKAFHAMGEHIYDAADRELAKPMWERDISEMQILLDRIESSLWRQIRWSLLPMLIPAFDPLLSVGDTAAMQRDGIRTTIALFRYKAAEHRWPADLGALIPAYLDTLPIDRFDGEPLRYRLDENDEPILYSVGSDLDDDSGVSPIDSDGWPTPNGANRWYSPSKVAKQKSLGPGDKSSIRLNIADGDFVLYPPLPDKPVELEPDPYADFP